MDRWLHCRFRCSLVILSKFKLWWDCLALGNDNAVYTKAIRLFVAVPAIMICNLLRSQSHIAIIVGVGHFGGFADSPTSIIPFLRDTLKIIPQLMVFLVEICKALLIFLKLHLKCVSFVAALLVVTFNSWFVLLFAHLPSSLLGDSTSITTRSSRSVQKQVSASSLRNFPTLPFGEISSSVHSLRWIRVIMSVSSSRLPLSVFQLFTCRPPSRSFAHSVFRIARQEPSASSCPLPIPSMLRWQDDYRNRLVLRRCWDRQAFHPIRCTNANPAPTLPW